MIKNSGANSSINNRQSRLSIPLKKAVQVTPETEIAHKREALENVLIPYRMDENFELLRGAGFGKIEVFFRWYNFCGIIAVK